MMACCVHDLAAKEAKTLSYLYEDIKKQKKLTYLAQTKTQFLGTLRMYFADSFEFIQGEDLVLENLFIKYYNLFSFVYITKCVYITNYKQKEFLSAPGCILL